MSTINEQGALNVETQAELITFKNNSDGNFSIITKGGALGNAPIVKSGFCNLPPIGKKGSDYRGIKIFKTKRGDYFPLLKLAITEENSPNVIKMCRRILDAWRDQYSPVRKSMWYQNTFGFEDGTKVFDGTIGISTPENFCDFIFEGSQYYESPSQTFAKALYGDENNGVWYKDLSLTKENEYNKSIVENSYLFLYDVNNKRLKTKNSNGMFVYPSSGISLSDNNALTRLFESDLFMKNTWTCITNIIISGIQWKKGFNTSTGKHVLYPIFKMRSIGSIAMKKVEYTQPEGVIPVEQRLSVLNAALFDGLEAPPSKKRKRSVIKDKKPGVKVSADFESELLDDSDVEGED